MSTAVTPEITINNTAAEIRAAMEAQAAAEVQPVESAPVVETPSAPSSPEWGQMAENTDGTYQVTLATGEVFKGTATRGNREAGRSSIQHEALGIGLEAESRVSTATAGRP